MGTESECAMRTITRNFRIFTYGTALSEMKATDVRETARGLAVSRNWSSLKGQTRDTGEYLLVSSKDLDDTFAETFREHATPATRLLVFRDEGASTDRLLSRILRLQIRTPERLYILDATCGSGKTL